MPSTKRTVSAIGRILLSGITGMERRPSMCMQPADPRPIPIVYLMQRVFRRSVAVAIMSSPIWTPDGQYHIILQLKRSVGRGHGHHITCLQSANERQVVGQVQGPVCPQCPCPCQGKSKSISSKAVVFIVPTPAMQVSENRIRNTVSRSNNRRTCYWIPALGTRS